jgi:hypothetical protein
VFGVVVVIYFSHFFYLNQAHHMTPVDGANVIQSSMDFSRNNVRSGASTESHGNNNDNNHNHNINMMALNDDDQEFFLRLQASRAAASSGSTAGVFPRPMDGSTFTASTPGAAAAAAMMGGSPTTMVGGGGSDEEFLQQLMYARRLGVLQLQQQQGSFSENLNNNHNDFAALQQQLHLQHQQQLQHQFHQQQQQVGYGFMGGRAAVTAAGGINRGLNLPNNAVGPSATAAAAFRMPSVAADPVGFGGACGGAAGSIGFDDYILRTQQQYNNHHSQDAFRGNTNSRVRTKKGGKNSLFFFFIKTIVVTIGREQSARCGNA